MKYKLYVRTSNLLFNRWMYTNEWFITFQCAELSAQAMATFTGRKTKLVEVN